MPNIIPIIYPYKMGSKSAKLLSSALRCRRVYPDRNFRPHRNHVIINWGSSIRPHWYDTPIEWAVHLNDQSAVKIASNKLLTFEHFIRHFVNHPDWSDCRGWAESQIEHGRKIICRTLLTSNSGKGIVVASTVGDLVDAPLYTMLVKKDKEYRVHVFNGRVIDFVQKKKREGVEDRVPYIRSHNNGWIFARQGVVLPDNVKEEAIKAVACLGLDFGAVDIATTHDGNVVVFEVNTAPGLAEGGTTLQKYVQAIREIL